ncbi:MAG TPA: hypothetical protein ENN80_13250, partial [Candidatus Hydrogenedentes bacterium]|nr:hypothetical protein [Candidatus Hydrogenedentota bacterium]
IGYVTNTRQWGIDKHGDADAWEPWWKSPDTRLLHFIGKDNVPFHAVMFPCYLMAQDGFILADNVLGNEYLNVFNRQKGKAEKGSKSKGNMISVRWMVSKVKSDVIRYYLCAIMPETHDAAFDWDEFMNRYNGELCDVVGNFAHRVLTMTHKNFDAKVPEPGALDEDDNAMLAYIPEQVDAIGEALDGFRFRLALERFIDLGRRANQYFDAKQPWATRKTDLERTATTLYVSCQVVHALCYTMAPFMPEGARQLAAFFDAALPNGGPDGGKDGWELAKRPLAAGTPLDKPVVLFPKLDKDELADLAAQHEQGKAF